MTISFLHLQIFGRKVSSDKLVPIMMEKVARPDLSGIINCKCTSSKCLKGCSCAIASVLSLAGCLCLGERAQVNLGKVLHYHSTFLSSNLFLAIAES